MQMLCCYSCRALSREMVLMERTCTWAARKQQTLNGGRGGSALMEMWRWQMQRCTRYSPWLGVTLHEPAPNHDSVAASVKAWASYSIYNCGCSSTQGCAIVG